MHLAGQREAHDARVIEDDNDDRESAEKIEARLALAVREARVDSEPEGRFSFVCRPPVDAWTVANGFRK
jgi:hypothetical protein